MNAVDLLAESERLRTLANSLAEAPAAPSSPPLTHLINADEMIAAVSDPRSGFHRDMLIKLIQAVDEIQAHWND